MSYEERAEQYCKDCKFYDECRWPIQKRYANCIDGQTFMYGWELGKRDTIEEIEKFLKQKNDRDTYTIGYIKRHFKEIIKGESV